MKNSVKMIPIEVDNKNIWPSNVRKPWVVAREKSDREKLRLEKPLVYEKIMKYGDRVKNGEPVPLIVLNYDYLCNFQCDHCCADLFMNKTAAAERADKRRKMNPMDVRKLADQAHEMGLGNFVISGGEPLTYKAFDEVVEAIGPDRFYIGFDTNAWFLTPEKARHLKSIGVDKAQISLDSFNKMEHDRFRKKIGSYDRCMKGVDNALAAGLKVIVMTCLTKSRAYSQEFRDLLNWGKSKGVGIYVTYAKPVGAWQGDTSDMCGDAEFQIIADLSNEYDVFTRTTGGHGIALGCIAVKRSVTVTKYGDVMPCPYIHTSIGNIFVEKLDAILTRGLRIKHFSYGEVRTCLAGNKDHYFVEEYMSKIKGHNGAIPYQKIFGPDDFVDGIVA